jgi:site-specific DNA-methyltransferase (adenine-specific)
MASIQVLHGDCLALLPTLAETSIDAIITDPPYGIGFMGRNWDHGVPGVPFWAAMLRVLKPGGHLVAFGGARTYHRLACAIEDAGFEIRDQIMWLYGSGFPKSLDVGKATTFHGPTLSGTHGSADSVGKGAGRSTANVNGNAYGNGLGGIVAAPHPAGRWPANVIHDGSDEVMGAFPDSAPSSGRPRNNKASIGYGGSDVDFLTVGYEDAGGSAARFFYSSKADKDDRLSSRHPTVKPVDLMAYLCRLVCPPGGLILDPFAGSGSTGMACMREGFDAILIEREAEYVADIRRKIAHVSGEDTPLFTRTAACPPR